MEDGDGTTVALTSQMNGDSTTESIMANFPEIEVTKVKHKPNATLDSIVKVNGDTEKDSEQNSPDEDALVIDEDEKPAKPRTKRKKLLPSPAFHGFKGFKRKEVEDSHQLYNNYIPIHTTEGETYDIPTSPTSPSTPSTTTLAPSTTTTYNSTPASPPFNDAAAATTFSHHHHHHHSQQHHRKLLPLKKQLGFGGKKNKKNPSPKLREYAQYLGLQPTVKFKCSKCEVSSFPSLSALNDHHVQCLSQPCAPKPQTCNAMPSQQSAMTAAPAPPSTNFRVTRKVYLCSACGTYYENWNLFLHMREVHKRFICLYCLGMFSQPEKLSYHLVAKHNCNPGQHNSAEEFLKVYKDPCFLMCCDCERVFTEQENFYGHLCANRAPPGAVASSSNNSVPHSRIGNNKQNAKAKNSSAKSKKSAQSSRPLEPSQHVTADMDLPEEGEEEEPEPEPEPEEAEEVERRNEEPAAESPRNEEDVEQPGEFTGECRIKKEVPEENGEEERLSEVPPTSNGNGEPLELLGEQQNSNEAPGMDDNTRSSLPEDDAHASRETSTERRQMETEEAEDDSQTSNNLGHNSRTDETAQEENEVKQEDSNSDDDDGDDEKNDSSIRDDSVTDPDNDQDMGGADDEDEEDEDEEKEQTAAVVQEKVPPLTLKLPLKMLNNYSDGESDFDESDCEKLLMEVDENENSEAEADLQQEQEPDLDQDQEDEAEPEQAEAEAITPEKAPEQVKEEVTEESIPVAGSEVAVIELVLEQPLDKFCIKMLLKKCLSSTVPICVYCNHARKIAVNGKQLGLHAIAEHRFSGTVNSITAEELIPESFNSRIKESFAELEQAYFNLELKTETTDLEEGGSEIVPFDRLYECFQCRYVTTIHKELYLHNRKMHAKTILLCIMCKSNFFSYSELLCHLCPGTYALSNDIAFRCCLCVVAALPSAFRLMVHLRKRHHTCDVCLELCHNQSKLSNHVWKHKLHHLCYRCGIAYRNKPDITKHLFWKHGTESVVCKKCLQKKWPHVYHFCIPPNAFVCEECTQSFTKAVALKVHKRLHSNEFPHPCTEENCTQKFISKKLLQKHEFKHREPAGEELLGGLLPEKMDLELGGVVESKSEEVEVETMGKETTIAAAGCAESEPVEPVKEKPKVKIDVYDLPALNLSESDSSDSEEEKEKAKKEEAKQALDDALAQGEKPDISALLGDESNKSATIVDGIWENFKNYQAAKGLQDVASTSECFEEFKSEEKRIEEQLSKTTIALLDHDYCSLPVSPTKELQESKLPESPHDASIDHDYCTLKEGQTEKDAAAEPGKQDGPEGRTSPSKKKPKTPKKKKRDGSSSSSDSSSDSDSSSCTCGSNCSCSSSSGSSSSSSSSSDSDSSSSEGRRRIAARRERRKQKALNKKKESEGSQAVDVVVTDPMAVNPFEAMLLETDLDTDETETDEDFYDEHPQKLASKMLAEKRNQLMMGLVLSNGTPEMESSRPTTPSLPEAVKEEAQLELQQSSKKKAKSKKRKKKNRSEMSQRQQHQQHQHLQLQTHNIPTYYNHHQTSHANQTHIQQQALQPATPSPVEPASVQPALEAAPLHRLSVDQRSQTQGSGGSDAESKRCSKRKRVRNKFYGYSSDEDGEHPVKPPAPPVLKWRKADLPSPSRHQTISSPQQFVPSITIKAVPSPAPLVEPLRTTILRHPPPAAQQPPDSESESETVQGLRKSSGQSDSSAESQDSDSDTPGQLRINTVRYPPAQPVGHGLTPAQQQYHAARAQDFAANAGAAAGAGGQRTDNLYCYCQCPYDEVSEMIACDGRDCTIEWFHFECVGIMVPPKGKWYCPECRKKNSLRGELVHA